MKKLVLLFGTLLMVSNANAETLRWSNDAEDAFNAMSSSSYYSRSRFQKNADGTTNTVNTANQLVTFKLNSSVADIWSDFNVRLVKGTSTSGRTVKSPTFGTESCQCVAAVKELTGVHSSTTTWIEGAAITPGNLPTKGDVIATFTNGVYDYGHTAIVVGFDGNGQWVEVIDQNWNPIVDYNFASRYNGSSSNDDCTWNAQTAFNNADKKGFMMKHRISFGGSGTNDLSNYSVVEIN